LFTHRAEVSMSTPRIAVIDYGAGNLRSVAKALARSEMDPVVTGDPDVVRACAGVVLPGVGAFRDAATSLRAARLDEAVSAAIRDKRPYLGLCFGLQLLFDEGEEHGITEGFGLLAGRVRRFPDRTRSGEVLRVPHIGWNEVVFSGSHPMLERLPERDYFYFVHSYRGEPEDASIVVGRTDYGGEFASAVATEALFAVQFHPEKSQAAGKRLLDAYRHWVRES
jgi:glutamine amidotransferase